MYPTEPATLEALGRDAERLLREITSWVVRRKETFTPEDDRIVRRAMSVDFELPSWVQVHGAPKDADDDDVLEHGISYAPLFFLQKGSDDLPPPSAVLEVPPPHFAGFDLRNQTGRAMSLPPRSWNAQVSLQAMLCALRAAATAPDIDLTEDGNTYAAEALSIIATADRNEAVQLLSELRQVETADTELAAVHLALLADDNFAWLVAACAVASIAMVPLIGREGRRGIVKLEYLHEIDFRPTRNVLRPAAGFEAYEFWFDTPYVGARTYHVEIPAPPGMEFVDAGLIRVKEYEANPNPLDHEVLLDRASGFAQQVHLYVDSAGAQHGTLTWIRLRTRRREFVVGATFLAFIISAVLWIAYGLQENVRSAAAGMPALLLLFPAAAATYAARAGSHAISKKALFVARGLLMLASAMPYTAAGVIALSPRHGDIIVGQAFECWLFGLAVTASSCALLLLVGSLLPQPRVRWQRMASPYFHERRKRKPEDWQPWFGKPSRLRVRRWLSRRLTGRDPGRR